MLQIVTDVTDALYKVPTVIISAYTTNFQVQLIHYDVAQICKKNPTQHILKNLIFFSLIYPTTCILDAICYF